MENIKVLVVSDLHGQKFTLEIINKYLNKNQVDAVFCCGDLCNNHDPNALKFAQDFIDLIKYHNHLPLFLVHGNQEPESVLELFDKENISVHLKEKDLFGYKIVGVGYGDEIPEKKDYFLNKIVLTHEPPLKNQIEQLIKQKHLINSPLIHFAGHLHKYSKIYKIGLKSQIVLVPTLQNHQAVILTLPDKTIDFIQIF